MSRRLSATPAVVALVALSALAACRGRGASPSRDAGDPEPRAAVQASAPASVPEAGPTPATGDGDEDDEAFASGTPRAARSIGHTSVVFKIELTNGKKAAFKPASRRGPFRYKGEVAARRLGLALGLSNVPRAFVRTFEASALTGAKHADEMIVTSGHVKGALIPWIDGLELLALETAPTAANWKRWLRRGEPIPEDQRELARQISTLIAFDFVTGNWDRWSGGNVGIDKKTGTLLFIDNDGAFFEIPPADALRRNRTLVEGVDKLSRGFVQRLRALDDEELARAIGEEEAGVPLLSAKALGGVSLRRRELLAIVDRKLSDAGDDATLAFP